jgi:hypothetical protein
LGPTNTAFDALPPGHAFYSSDAPFSQHLTDILLYHVSMMMCFAALTCLNGDVITMLETVTYSVSNAGGTPLIKLALRRIARLSNGVAFIIGQVLPIFASSGLS